MGKAWENFNAAGRCQAMQLLMCVCGDAVELLKGSEPRPRDDSELREEHMRGESE